MNTSTIFGITNWCLTIFAGLLYLSIFIIVIKCHRELHNLSVILTCNTCLAAFLTCITVFIMVSSNLFNGYLLHDIHFCYVWGLFYDIFECSIYYSYCLQAFFRLCRVVFYKKRFLVSYSLYNVLIIVQWILVFSLLVPTLFLQWYIRLPTETYCLIPYTDTYASTYLIIVLYLIPLIFITTIYIWITLYVRQSSHPTATGLTINRRQRNLRDLTVIKRIIILISILMILRFPTIIFIIYGVIAGHLFAYTYAIVGLITLLCMIFIALITIHITPELRNNILNLMTSRDNRVDSRVVTLHQLSNQVAIHRNTTPTVQKSDSRNLPHAP
ncbi:unnamed protein product [Adineta steineri]|uniref:G-protein coupled receptors family 1 profile domain-containing protein n=3 Tax=Adineta steineri TaxID=433720 RepID=A0A815M6Z2_9BILA|nr:unnamed protein product [Adineta steineri]